MIRYILRKTAAFICVFSMLCLMITPFAYAQGDNVVDTENRLDLKSKSAILVDEETGKVLYEYNADEQLRPASVTKVMTLLLIVEALERGEFTLDDMVTASSAAVKMGGSQIWLKEGEQMSVRDLFKSIVITSANDSSYAMAELTAGSNNAFVMLMNERAKELGMVNTNFVNCHGLDDDGHFTSARDIAIMSRELMKHPIIYDYTTIWMDSLRDGKSVLNSTNKLLKTYNGITGLKTGSTSLALYSMSATAKRQGVSLISVVMAAPTGAERFADAAKVLDYGFSSFQSVVFTPADEIMAPIAVKYGQEKDVSVGLEDDVSMLVKKGTQDNIIREIEIPDSLEAPITKGQKIGEITYKIGDETISQTPIVALEDVDRLTFKFSLWQIICDFFMEGSV